MFDFIFICSMNMIFPLIFKLFYKKDINNKWSYIISIINFLVLEIISLIITGGISGSWMAWSVFCFFINAQILGWKEAKKVVSTILLIESITCFICSLFIAFIILFPLAVVSLIAFVVYKMFGEELFSFVCDKCNAKADETDIFCHNCGNCLKNEISKTIDVVICKKCNFIAKTTDIFCQSCGNRLIILCTNCNAKVEENDNFCQSCGNRLIEEKQKEKDVILCTKCNAKAEETDIFCHNCGNRLIEGKQKEKDNIVCEKCNAKVEETDIFCHNCGNRLIEEKQKENQPIKPKRKTTNKTKTKKPERVNKIN